MKASSCSADSDMITVSDGYVGEAGLVSVRNVLILMPPHVFNVSQPSEKLPQAAQTQLGGLRTRRKTVKKKKQLLLKEHSVNQQQPNPNNSPGLCFASIGTSSWDERRVPGYHSRLGRTGGRGSRGTADSLWFNVFTSI